MARRGRPTIDDDALLKKVAARIARHPEQSPRSAIVQALPEFSDSAVRRLQRKWRKGGEAYLKSAQEALREQPPVSVSMAELHRKFARIQLPSHDLDKLLRVSRQMQDMLEGGAMGRAISQAQRVQKSIDAIFPRKLFEHQERMQRFLNSISIPR